jgi:TolB-like protein/DNA-binding winged helix-turn-helix (wHTH) protein/tetratricopeptide (TPR) repeat protein
MNETAVGTATSPIDLAREPEFALAGLHILPAERLVEQHGIRRELQPRVMQVLVALAASRPRVVSRDELIERCWGGRIVGDDALNRCILALRHLARDFEPAPFMIETVPRIGHRLIETGVAPPSNSGKPKLSRSRALLVTAALFVAVVAAMLLWHVYQPREPAKVAILPFQSISKNDSFFAEGVGEEILNQLAEEPEFLVASRTSTAQYRNAADLRQVGRALGVDYVLEGSVRTETGRVRVNASLVQTSDGMRLWSQTYDRKLDDILAIQQAIGSSVAQALSRRFSGDTSHGVPPAINGEAYRDYLSARGMLRTRIPLLGENAVGLLRHAVVADPNYAPAWSSLAEAIRLKAALEGPERVIAILPEAQADARRAIALAPDLAEAHGVLGVLLGFTSREAQAHLRRAAQLDPHSAEAQLWLASAERVAGNFPGEIAAYRRAVALDPHWFRPTRDLVIAVAEMGDRRAAEELAANSHVDDSHLRLGVTARIAWLFGDYVEAAKIWTAEAKIDSLTRAPATDALINARFTLDLPGASPPPPWPAIAELRIPLSRIWLPGAPSSEAWQQHNRNDDAAMVYHGENLVAAKLMLAANRASELIWAYDRPSGLLGIRKGQPIEPYDLHAVPLAALALDQVGRRGEAERMLSQAQEQVDAVFRRGQAPFTFDVDAAAIASASGRRDHAIAALQRALRRGWSHSAPDDLTHLSAEPAFAALGGDRRFTEIAANFDALIARERRKALALGL